MLNTHQRAKTLYSFFAIFSLPILIAGLMPLSVLAQDESSPVTITISPARVDKNIEDIPAAVSTVGQQQIQTASEQLGLDESLSQVPGLFFLNRYNFAQDLRASIRGFGARSSFGIRGIKIIVDGIPETLPDGQGSVDGVDIGSARQITVIRGPASSLYGNASGGAILIETEKAEGLPFVEFKLTAGDYDYTKPQVKVGGSNGDLQYLLNLSDTQIDGYRDHSEFENTQLNGRFDYQLADDASLLTTIHYTDQPIANDPGGINLADATADPEQARDRNLQFDAGEALEQTRIGMLYRKQLDNNREMETRVYHASRDFSNKLPFQGGGAVVLDRRFIGAGLTYTHRSMLASKPSRLLLGFDFDYQDDDRQRFDNLDGVLGPQTFEQTEQVTSLGIFVQDEIKLTERAELTLGLRYDDIEFDVSDQFLGDGDDSGKVTLDNFSPMVGISYRMDQQTRYYATISTAFETPTTTEFANPSGGGFNQNLDPQEATNFEVGYKYGDGRYQLDAAVFYIDVKDELIPFELAAQPGRTFFENAGSSSRKGLELAYSARMSDSIKLSLAYTWSDFVFDQFVDDNGNDFKGKQIPGIPQHLLHLDLSWNHPEGYFATLKNTWTGELFADNANNTEVEATQVSDLRVGYQYFHNQWEMDGFIGVNNLLDETYFSNIRINAFGGRFYEPAPERNWLIGFTIRKKFSR